MFSSQDWKPLGESIQIRQLPLYSMNNWDVNEETELQRGLVIGCPFGGPICLLREDADQRLEVWLYSQSGKLLKRFFPFRDPPVSVNPSSGGRRHVPQVEVLAKGGVGWTGAEEILCLVSQSGQLVLFEASSFRERSFSLNTPIVQASCHSGRIVCLLDDGFLCVSDIGRCFSRGTQFKEPTIERFAAVLPFPVGSMGFFTSSGDDDTIAVVVSSSREARLTKFELSSSDTAMMTSLSGASLKPARETAHYQLRARDQGASSTIPFVGVCASPSGRVWAATNYLGEIFVFESVSLKVVFGLSTEADAAPFQLTWCGEDAVAASFSPDIGLLLVDSSREVLWLQFPSAICLVTEHDCLRILTPTAHELLERVSPSLDDALRIGSTAPAAMLLDASESLQSSSTLTAESRSAAGDAKAYENVRALRLESLLFPAVVECARAAMCEFYVDQQQLLLKAAASGKVFLGETHERKSAARMFLKACSFLKVLNTVRHESIGFPLTIGQLDRMGGIPGLCLRLARWNHHFLALKSLEQCAHVIHPSKVERTRLAITRHWARRSIAGACPGGYLLFPRLFPPPLGTSGSGGRATTSTDPNQQQSGDSSSSLMRLLPRLLPSFSSSGPSPQEQQASSKLFSPPPPLDPAAVRKAREVTSKIRSKFTGLPCAYSDFAREAMALGNRELALELLRLEPSLSKRVGRLVQFRELESALELCQKEGDLELVAFVKSFMVPCSSQVEAPPSAFVAQQMKERARFVKRQSSSPTASSVLEAIRASIAATGSEIVADQLRKDFNVSELGYWVARARAYASRRDWSKLEDVARERGGSRAAILVEICCQLGFSREAARFVRFIRDEEEQVDALLDCGEFAEAISRVRTVPRQQRGRVSLMVRGKLSLATELTEDDKERLERMLASAVQA